MNSTIDPWVILPKERSKYQEQFQSLQPNDGIITGPQARNFFLQSQLPAMILGEIWSLADTDSDGKMDINEFSIACKLINLKLRGFNVPASVPPSLLASLPSSGSIANTPTTNNAVNLNLSGLMTTSNTMIPQMPSYNPVQSQQNMSSIMSQPIIPMVDQLRQQQQQQQQQQQPLIVTAPLIEPMPIGMMIGTTMQSPPQKDNLLNNIVSSSYNATTVSKLPSPPTPPNSNSSQMNRNMSIGERALSIETGTITTTPAVSGPNIEWAIKGPTKLKYTQLFNTTDRTRSGYLTGVQARHLMVQTKLPQSTLAQIWSLADMDLDGRLGCEEFVLAMYLCDVALQGETIPAKLPYDLIPPSFRKALSRHGSIANGRSRGGSVTSAAGAGGGVGGGTGSINSSRQGSITSIQGGITGGTLIDGDPSAGLPGQTSFEDKRKENFDKGQAELERRRKVLLDIQRKEQEERERKEREEADKREKARLDIERRQREELERQLQLQKEIEMEKEEKRKREIEQKEMARKEMEKQRQLEWEKQRITEMQLQRQHEQEKVLKLKAQNQTYNIELSTLTEKVKDLSQKICDTRAGVTNVKSVIDGMRSTRDIQMNDMSQLKTRIKEQNQKLVQLSQEKLKLENKNKQTVTATAGAAAANGPEQLNAAAFSNKQIIINQLRDKLKMTKEDVNCKSTEYTINTEQLTELKENLKDIIIKCEELYGEYDGRRIQVLELKNTKKIEMAASFGGVGGVGASTWDDASTINHWPTDTNSHTQQQQQQNTTAINYTKYRAIYEFSARNSDEITFQTGDIIMVPLEQTGEPGWLSGEINGHTGWFPSTYVELIPDDDTAKDHLITENNTFVSQSVVEAVQSTEPITVAVEEPLKLQTPSSNTNDDNIICEYYIASYPYQSNETGDLVFEVGEYITVIKKDGDWWTGTIGDSRCGIFPSNYVEPVTISSNYNDNVGNNETIQTTVNNGSNQQEQNQRDVLIEKMTKTSIAEITADNQIQESKITQEDTADTEVSEINTHTNDRMTEQNMESYSRPMSTSSNATGFKKNRDVAQVIAPYEATSTEQLTLQRGQLINIRKKTDSGWWEGELQVRGKRKQIGWFPATYVKVLHSGRTSGRNTPVSGGKIQMNETVLDKVIALFPYKAQNHDELSFEKDDIISVHGRDEPEWWRGECQGLAGLFPSNYVGPFIASGNN